MTTTSVRTGSGATSWVRSDQTTRKRWDVGRNSCDHEAMSGAAAFEPSPFDDDDDDVEVSEETKAAREAREAGKFLPYTVEEFDRVSKRAPHLRMVDPWRCAYNLAAPGGVKSGWSSDGSRYPYKQCRMRIADPTKSRYCYEHAMEVGAVYYSPEEGAAIVSAESTANLLRLVPKAIRTIEAVMDDEEAPHGVRAKAADSVLDRTGYGKGLEINLNAKVEVTDPLATLRERLDGLRDAQMEAAARMAAEAAAEERGLEDGSVVEAEIVEDGSESA
jgi:hypothetical protein